MRSLESLDVRPFVAVIQHSCAVFEIPWPLLDVVARVIPTSQMVFLSQLLRKHTEDIEARPPYSKVARIWLLELPIENGFVIRVSLLGIEFVPDRLAVAGGDVSQRCYLKKQSDSVKCG